MALTYILDWNTERLGPLFILWQLMERNHTEVQS